MKKKLLLLIIAMGIISFANAQIIELIGMGTLNNPNPNLNLTDINTIDHVEVEAIYKGIGAPLASDVLFYDADEGPISIWKTDQIMKPFGFADNETYGYYEATFNTFDVGGLYATIIPSDKVHSFYAYVYRNIPNSTYKSFISPEVVFFWKNGSIDPYEFNIQIETASAARNVTVKIPISELDQTGRNVVIDITAGPITKHIEETTFNLGNSFFLGEYLLENVPGDVNNIVVSIYSPNPAAGEWEGDSFYVSGVVADVDKVNEDPGCTLTQGYWKTHSTCKVNRNGKGPKRDDTWDKLADAEETIFFSSRQDYCEVFATEPGDGGKYYILAHQYIAAQLNMFNGADMSAAAAAFTEATTFLNNHSPQDVDGDLYLESKAVDLGGILADFNEGKIGPGHCDDGYKEEMEKSYSNVNVYPNPVTDYGTISLDSNNKGRMTIELFNFKGQRVDVIYDSEFERNEKLSKIEFNTFKYKKGRYFLIIKDGNKTHRKQLVVR